MKKLLALALALCLALSLGITAAHADGVGGTQYPNPLQDVRVRQALWYAIDMDTIVDALWNNTVVAANKSLVPEGFWQADGLTEYVYDPVKAKRAGTAATPSKRCTTRATCWIPSPPSRPTGAMWASRWSSSCSPTT